MFADPAPQHRGGDVAAAALFLGIVQDLEHDALAAGEAVANIRQEVGDRFEICPHGQGLNSVFSFFFTATPLIFTYAGRPSL
jgi:hypothetical protein